MNKIHSTRIGAYVVTVEERMESARPRALTYWAPDRQGGRIPSQFGIVTHREWCIKESARMTLKGAHVYIGNDFGMLAIVKVRGG
jgi:hypothetical protein